VDLPNKETLPSLMSCDENTYMFELSIYKNVLLVKDSRTEQIIWVELGENYSLLVSDII
jgi:hypothetical protein